MEKRLKLPAVDAFPLPNQIEMINEAAKCGWGLYYNVLGYLYIIYDYVYNDLPLLSLDALYFGL